MTNLPLAMRRALQEKYSILQLSEVKKVTSTDNTVKFLFKLDDEDDTEFYIESVLLQDKSGRYTFCISTQCGCRMGCTFCKTGSMGLQKNLTYDEILSQILFLADSVQLTGEDKKFFNIVFMGMGEPLDNKKELIKTIGILLDKDYFALSAGRITVSTCGLLDAVPEVFDKFPKIRLAVSLNSARQEQRVSIMPIARRYPVDRMAKQLLSFYDKYQKRITLEYVLLKNFNDTDMDIKALDVFKGPAFHLNIIPYNSADPKDPGCPTEPEISSFITKLEKRGFAVSRRYRRGRDIQAACGQLYTEFSGK